MSKLFEHKDFVNTEPKWKLPEALELCLALETVSPAYGAHVGLTGGLLYKDGERKDLDLLVYRIRDREHVDLEGLRGAFVRIGLEIVKVYGDWITKFTWQGRKIDMLFPEAEGGNTYPEEQDIEPNVEGFVSL